MTRTAMAAVLAAALPALLGAEDYRHGRVRYAEDGVSLQRADEQGSEEARANMPFLPGDRVWTDDRGRAEFQFGSAAFLRLDDGTKLDYLDDAGGRAVLRLWSGSLYAHSDGVTGFEIETPAGVIATRGRGIHRVDARAGGVRLSVYEGEATLDGEPPIRVREGERVLARDGDLPRAEQFDRAAADDFAMWADDRQEKVRYARELPPELPAAGAPFYDELYDHGAWVNEQSVGSVWYPSVPLGWSPYTFGRWMWAPYGWTWIAAEPWGWAPAHYGRWGFSSRGWYWIPRGEWSPAWVQWAVGGPVLGWCPLGYNDRPLFDPYANVKTPLGRHASLAQTRSSWRFARANELTKWNHTGNGLQQFTHATPMRVVASSRARLTKDLQVVDGPIPVATPRTGAVPRRSATRARYRAAAPVAAEAPAPPPSAPAPAPPSETFGTGTRQRARFREQPAGVAAAAPEATPRVEQARPRGQYSAPRVLVPRESAPAAEPAPRARGGEPRSAAPRTENRPQPQPEPQPAAAAQPRERSSSDEAAPRARKNAADPASTDGGARRRSRQ